MAEFGTESCFNTISTRYNAVAMLDSTHVVVAYRDDGGDIYGCAKVGVIDGNTVTWGAENIFNSATTNYINITGIDSTHFVIVYQDAGNSNYGTAIVGSVSGTTISSYGAENVFNTATTVAMSVSSLDSTRFVVGFKDDGGADYGIARIGAISGTTISSYGAENVFNSAATDDISVSTLDSTHFVVAYRDTGNSSYGTAIVGVVSGTTISSYGAENVFNSAPTVYLSVSTLDSTHFVVAYRDNGNSSYGTAIVGVVSGTTISSYGAENVFNSAPTVYLSVSVLDGTHFVVVYQDADGLNYYGSALVGVVSGTTISSYGSESVFNASRTDFISVAALSSTDYIVVYRDDGADGYGCARAWASLGWSGTIIGISSPAKVMGIEVTNITSVIGIS